MVWVEAFKLYWKPHKMPPNELKMIPDTDIHVTNVAVCFHAVTNPAVYVTVLTTNDRWQ